MNEVLTKVLMIPTREQLDSAATPESLIELVFRADVPCRLYTVQLLCSSWVLDQITLCRRLMIWGENVWGVGAVLLPGQTLEVTIRSECFHPQGTSPPEVQLELYVDAQPPIVRKPPVTDEEKLALAKMASETQRTAKESFLKKIRGKEDENIVRGFYEQQRAKYPPNIPPGLTATQIYELLRGSPKEEVVSKEPEPGPPPTRFSELDIEDDEPPSS